MSKEEVEPSQNNLLQKTYRSTMVALPSVVLTFGAGHPFELVKTQMQAYSQFQSGILLSKKIFQESGIKGFYHAGASNFFRGLVKASYRNPVRGAISAKYTEMFPQLDKTEVALMTGLTMPVVDILILPLDRIKTWLMTNERSVKDFFLNRNANSLPLIQDLFKGVKISIARGVVSWTTFLVPETLIREAVIEHSARVDKTNRVLPLPEQVLVGGLSGLVNCLCTLPLDTIKTKMYQDGFHQSASIRTMFEVGKSQVQKLGLAKGLYPSFLVTLAHYVIVGVITSNLIQQMDHIWQPNMNAAPSLTK